MSAAWAKIAEPFRPAKLNKLSLKLNPFRTIAIKSEVFDMVYFSEKFEFAATHKLWNNQFSEQKNMEVFGKCANPTGHGHNYVVEVTVKMPPGRDDFNVCDFEQVVDKADAEADAVKMLKGEFTFHDFQKQISMLKKMGSIRSLFERGSKRKPTVFSLIAASSAVASP